MRSRFGAAGAATVIASIIGGIVAGATAGDAASRYVIHFGVGAGFLLFAVAVFDFRVSRAITAVGAAAAAIFGATFVLQGIADATGNEALLYVAFDVLGHALERVLPDVLLVWFAALLLTGSRGRSRLLGWLIVPAVIGLEVAGAAGPLVGREVPFLKIHLFLPFIWLFAESVEGVRGAAEARMSRVAATVAVVAVAGSLMGCIPAAVKGEGQAVVEPRDVAGFTRINAERGIDLRISIGATPSVEVRAQPNILAIVTTKVENGTLRITATQELDPMVSIEANVVTPQLEGISLTTGAAADIANIDVERLDIAIEAGAEVRATGSAATIRVDASGGAQAHLVALTAGRLEVEVSGGAFVEAMVTDLATGEASGGGRLQVRGPARVEVDASGGGAVSRA